MKISAWTLILVVSLGSSSVAQPGEKTYEVTGPLLETCCPANAARGEPPMQIVLQKGKQRMQIEIAWNAKVETQLKVGNTVKVHYTIGHARDGGVMYFTSKIEPAGGSKK